MTFVFIFLDLVPAQALLGMSLQITPISTGCFILCVTEHQVEKDVRFGEYVSWNVAHEMFCKVVQSSPYVQMGTVSYDMVTAEKQQY